MVSRTERRRGGWIPKKLNFLWEEARVREVFLPGGRKIEERYDLASNRDQRVHWLIQDYS